MTNRSSTSPLGDFAKDLRRNMTVPEKRLWGVLRGRRLAGLKFRRQMPVDKFIADFACVEHKLIVEVDGESHTGRYVQDVLREQTLIDAGWSVVRVSNDNVLHNLDGVLFEIIRSIGLDPIAWSEGKYGRLPDWPARVP